ncbi:MAG TPA: ribosome small subunit-dependent GTPase A [Lachnospiraceae bacterium]|jgi:ribosome small subunit-dependent GTPase A|nr:ribosome small subunit-dependent GTPase A [Lachnospiraceae bacterium]
MKKGTIVKGIGGFYYVNTETGVYECRARGKFRKEKVTPLVGDFVEISILDEVNKKGSLDVILPRKNELIRPRVANVEQAVIVFAAQSPSMNLDLLDRFIILVEQQHLDVLICINKIDLDVNEDYKSIVKTYRDAGFRVVPISADKGINMDLLKEELKGRISVFAGPSGVGKSSLINAINSELNLSTGTLSAKIERGKHTTRHAELMELFENSFIVDSPGFTSLFFEHILSADLQYYFREFEPYINNCRFTGCSHVKEIDCAIKEHIGETISPIRYDRYVSIYNELKDNEERKK